MKSVARSQIRTDARLLSDERPGGAGAFVSDSEVNRLIDVHTAKLYDKLLKARGQEYYADEDTISVVAGTSRYSLPDDFYELLSLTLEWGAGNHEDLEPYEFLERSGYRNLLTWARGSAKGYRVRGTEVEFLPVPQSPVTCRIQYVPAFTDFANDGATFDGVNGWERWIVLSVAIDLRTIRKLPFGDLQQLLSVEDDRIEELAAQRDAMHPARVRNVHPEARGRFRGIPWR